jgi:hypothetical protein
VGIIYQLEMINVGEQHKGAPILDARTAEFAAEQVHNYPTIEQRSERIVCGFIAHFFASFHETAFQMFLLRNVAADTD